MTECVLSKKPPFVSWWQGGERYKNIESPSGLELSLPFEKNAVSAKVIWNQLKADIKFRALDPGAIYGNSHPLNLEIGCGNGEFIAKYAAETPDENWLGAEVFKKAFEKAASRAGSSVHGNIRIIQFDADLILRLLPGGSLNSVYVNFPDPWPKSGHKKRRLLKIPFLEIISDKLRPGGTLHIATDHEDYAREILSNLAEVKSLRSFFDTPCVRNVGGYFPTKYYRKFVSEEGAYFFRYVKPLEINM